ncbi:hypothetical protein EXS56_02615 [Candidatus Kaiserbacteria bacterium]|nr:hypothetical protein [Candidatus Kaiserbacteria bacterium]
MRNKRATFAKTAAFLLAFAFPVIANSQTVDAQFPPNISQFTLKYQYHDSGDKYEYYLPNEQGDAWTKLITVVRRPENAGHATISDLEKISTSIMELADSFPAEVTNLKDYAASVNIPNTRSFIVAYQIAHVESNIWELELDLEKFFVKNGYVYVNLYAEKYQFSSAQALANALSTRRPVLIAAQDAFVKTSFPGIPSSSSVPSAPATTYTKVTDTFTGNQSSTNQITPQIQSILAQIAALQQKWNALQSPQTTTQTVQTPSTTSGAGCPALSRALSNGTRGDEVLALQQFLVAQEFLSSGLATGYFGANTQTAVGRWQVANKIFSSGSDGAPGYGVVGPRTRAEIALRCATSPSGPSTQTTRTCPLAQPPTALCSTGWRANTDSVGCVTSYKCALPLSTSQATSTTGACTAISLLCPSGTYDQVGPNCSHSCVSGVLQSTTLFANPTSGTAPLFVTFELRATDSTGSNGIYYTIEFGDGQATEFARTANPSMLHRYGSAGTYTATVTRRTGCGAWECLGSSTIVGTVTIIAGATSGTPPFSISSPTSGQSAQQGQGFTLSWDSQNAPAGSAVALWLVKSSGASVGLIARNQLANGTFSWQVPGPQCNSSGVCIFIADSPSVHYAEVGTYWVVGKLYTPADAYLGGFPPANPVTPAFFATATSSLFNIIK